METNNSPRRVLHVVDDGSLTGGAQRLVLELLLHNRATAWDVTLASPEGELADEARRAGIPVAMISYNRRFSLKTVRQLISLVRQRPKINILHSHLPSSNFHAYLAALITRIPHVATLHGEGIAYAPQFLRFLALARRTGTFFVSVSKEAAESLQREIGGQPVLHIYNGIDTQFFAPQSPTLLNDASPIVGCIGRLHPHKGQSVLLRSFAIVLTEFPEARVALVGDGEDRARLEVLARELHIEKFVVFHEYQKDVRPFLASFTVCAVPSRRESFGIIILEAGAMKKPVVATRVGGIPEVLGDAENGLLVPANDPQRLAEALLFLLRNPERAASLAESLHARVRENFSIRQCAERYAEVYAGLLERSQ